MSSNDKDEESLKRYYELYDEIEDSIKEAYKKGVYLGSLSQIKAIKKGVAHIYGEEGNISVKDLNIILDNTYDSLKDLSEKAQEENEKKDFSHLN